MSSSGDRANTIYDKRRHTPHPTFIFYPPPHTNTLHHTTAPSSTLSRSLFPLDFVPPKPPLLFSPFPKQKWCSLFLSQQTCTATKPTTRWSSLCSRPFLTCTVRSRLYSGRNMPLVCLQAARPRSRSTECRSLTKEYVSLLGRLCYDRKCIFLDDPHGRGLPPQRQRI